MSRDSVSSNRAEYVKDTLGSDYGKRTNSKRKKGNIMILVLFYIWIKINKFGLYKCSLPSLSAGKSMLYFYWSDLSLSIGAK